jgi:hypothetical protein
MELLDIAKFLCWSDRISGIEDCDPAALLPKLSNLVSYCSISDPLSRGQLKTWIFMGNRGAANNQNPETKRLGLDIFSLQELHKTLLEDCKSFGYTKYRHASFAGTLRGMDLSSDFPSRYLETGISSWLKNGSRKMLIDDAFAWHIHLTCMRPFLSHSGKLARLFLLYTAVRDHQSLDSVTEMSKQEYDTKLHTFKKEKWALCERGVYSEDRFQSFSTIKETGHGTVISR